MNKSRGAAAIAGILTAYLLVHAGVLGYAFYLIHDLANDPVGPANEFVAAAQNDHALFLSVFGVAAALSLLSAGSFVGLLKQVVWGRYCWLLTSVALAVSFLIALLLQAEWQHFVFPLLGSAAGWWCLLTDRRGRKCGITASSTRTPT